jgi:hypothetical protein
MYIYATTTRTGGTTGAFAMPDPRTGLFTGIRSDGAGWANIGTHAAGVAAGILEWIIEVWSNAGNETTLDKG